MAGSALPRPRDDAKALKNKLVRALARARARDDAPRQRTIEDRLRVFETEFEPNAARVDVSARWICVSHASAKSARAVLEIHAAFGEGEIDAAEIADRLEIKNAVSRGRGSVVSRSSRTTGREHVAVRYECELALRPAPGAAEAFPFDAVEAVAVISLNRGARKVHLCADEGALSPPAPALLEHCLAADFVAKGTTLRLMQLDVVRAGVDLERKPARYVGKTVCPSAALSAVGLAVPWEVGATDGPVRVALLLAVFLAAAALPRPGADVPSGNRLDAFLDQGARVLFASLLEAFLAAAAVRRYPLTAARFDAGFHVLLACYYAWGARDVISAVAASRSSSGAPSPPPPRRRAHTAEAKAATPKPGRSVSRTL